MQNWLTRARRDKIRFFINLRVHCLRTVNERAHVVAANKCGAGGLHGALHASGAGIHYIITHTLGYFSLARSFARTHPSAARRRRRQQRQAAASILALSQHQSKYVPDNWAFLTNLCFIKRQLWKVNSFAVQILIEPTHPFLQFSYQHTRALGSRGGGISLHTLDECVPHYLFIGSSRWEEFSEWWYLHYISVICNSTSDPDLKSLESKSCSSFLSAFILHEFNMYIGFWLEIHICWGDNENWFHFWTHASEMGMALEVTL